MHVCPACINEVTLADFIRAHASGQECAFCDAEGSEPIAAPLHVVARWIGVCAARKYQDPAECLPYESAEGGYQGHVIDTTRELLSDYVGLEVEDDLLDALADEIGEQPWCKNPFRRTRADELRFGWSTFKARIMHGDRFFLSVENRPADDDDEYVERTPGTMGILRAIDGFCESKGLFTTISAGTRFWRARPHAGSPGFTSSLDLGPPPRHLAIKSNRMTPPGVSALYVATDKETAILETCEEPAELTLGEFESISDLRVLDLRNVPLGPSFFEEYDQADYDESRFLFQLGMEIGRPVPRSESINVEYIPTQVVTEYFRRISTGGGARLHGIAYPSSRNAEGSNICFFCDPDAVEWNAVACAELQAASEVSVRWMFPPRNPKFRLVGTSEVSQTSCQDALSKDRPPWYERPRRRS